MFDSEKTEIYRTLKLEGIIESLVNICITCDRSRTGPVVLGRTATMDVYSSVCAVQNLCLATWAEELGVGWVNIINKEALQEAIAMTYEHRVIFALCEFQHNLFHIQYKNPLTPQRRQGVFNTNLV